MWWRRRLYLVTLIRAQRRRSRVMATQWYQTRNISGQPRMASCPSPPSLWTTAAGGARASPDCDRTPLSTPGSRRDLGHELHRPSRIHATVNRATAHALQASQPRSSLLATVAVAVKTMPIAELTGLAVRRSEHIWQTCSLMCASQRCKGGTLGTRGP